MCVYIYIYVITNPKLNSYGTEVMFKSLHITYIQVPQRMTSVVPRAALGPVRGTPCNNMIVTTIKEVDHFNQQPQ